jgi:hypothetical protein
MRLEITPDPKGHKIEIMNGKPEMVAIRRSIRAGALISECDSTRMTQMKRIFTDFLAPYGRKLSLLNIKNILEQISTDLFCEAE